VHGDGVAEPDVLAQALVVEDDACAVGEPFGGKAIRRLVDCGDAPAVAVSDLIHFSSVAPGAGMDVDGSVEPTARVSNRRVDRSAGHHRRCAHAARCGSCTRHCQAIVEIGRAAHYAGARPAAHLRVTARRAGADLRLLQKTLGHASITVTSHIYADLYDDELDDVASALDRLDDTRKDLP
jgi:hypothetical protein